MSDVNAISALKPSFYNAKSSGVPSQEKSGSPAGFLSELLQEGRSVTKSQEALVKNHTSPEPVIWDTTQWLNTFEIVNASVKAGTQAVKELLQVPL